MVHEVDVVSVMIALSTLTTNFANVRVTLSPPPRKTKTVNRAGRHTLITRSRTVITSARVPRENASLKITGVLSTMSITMNDVMKSTAVFSMNWGWASNVGQPGAASVAVPLCTRVGAGDRTPGSVSSMTIV